MVKKRKPLACANQIYTDVSDEVSFPMIRKGDQNVFAPKLVRGNSQVMAEFVLL